MEYFTYLKHRSTNKKTGPMPVSTSSRDTCPPTCAFYKNGCYAEAGPLRLHWDKVSSGERGMGWAEFCATIKALPDDTIWRHNQAGDLPGDGLTIDPAAIDALVDANAGKQGFTYTHYPVLGHSEIEAANRDVIRQANERGFAVNLSGNNLAHADHLASLGIGPVVTVMPMTAHENVKTPAGRHVVVCPAETRDNVTCKSCRICMRQRDVIVGFPAHGTSKKKASAIAEAA